MVLQRLAEFSYWDMLVSQWLLLKTYPHKVSATIGLVILSIVSIYAIIASRTPSHELLPTVWVTQGDMDPVTVRTLVGPDCCCYKGP